MWGRPLKACCKVLSDKFVKLNGMNVEKLLQRCGPPVEGKSITFAFSSGKNIVFVGLKDSTLAFDRNLEKFNKSVLTIKVDNQTNIKSILKLKWLDDSISKLDGWHSCQSWRVLKVTSTMILQLYTPGLFKKKTTLWSRISNSHPYLFMSRRDFAIAVFKCFYFQ